MLADGVNIDTDRLSISVRAEVTLLNIKINFLLWFFNRLLFRQTGHRIPAQQKADDVSGKHTDHHYNERRFR